MADTVPFPDAEFTARLDRLQEQMVQRNIDAMLLTTAADFFYVTGFLTRFWESPARPWFLLVPAMGAPIAVIPSIGETLMARTGLLDIRTWDAPDPDDDGVGLLTEAIREVVPPQGMLGVPMGSETHLRMPLADYHRMVSAIAPRQIVDATAPLQRTREIKSEAEIARIRTICGIAGSAFDALPDIAKPGRPLDAISRDFQAALLGHGADWVSYLAGAAGPDGYGDVIAPATNQPLRPGDVLMLDTGAVKDGYFCDFNRNVFIGPASDAVQRTQEALWHATEHTLSELRPGTRACDAHRLLSEDLRRKGAIPCGGRLGHGLGLSLTEWPSFTPQDQTELRAGMVLTLEPSAFVASDCFLTHEENIVLRDTGPELLSPRAPIAGHRVAP